MTATLDGAESTQMIDDLAKLLGAEMPPEDAEPETEAEESDDSTPEGDEPEADEQHEEEETEAEVTEDEQAEEDGEPEDARWMPRTLDELTEALETSEDELTNSLRVKVKVDGVEREATLAELRKNYQLESTANGRLEAAANMRKQLDAERQDIEQKRTDNESVANAVERLIFADYDKVNWEELKADDPSEYVIQQQQFQQRYQQVQQVKQYIEQERNKEMEQLQSKNAEVFQNYVNEQVQQLAKRLPEWNDESVFNKEMPALREYMKQDGLTDDELKTVLDHRIWLWANKARLYDNMKATADPKRKQMAKKPKFVAPGKRRAAPKATAEKAKQAAFNRAVEMQTDDAWADALVAKFSGE